MDRISILRLEFLFLAMCSGIGLAISLCSRCQSCLYRPSNCVFCLKQLSVEVALLLSNEPDFAFCELHWYSYDCISQDNFDRRANLSNELPASQIHCLMDCQRDLSLPVFGFSM